MILGKLILIIWGLYNTHQYAVCFVPVRITFRSLGLLTERSSRETLIRGVALEQWWIRTLRSPKPTQYEQPGSLGVLTQCRSPCHIVLGQLFPLLSTHVRSCAAIREIIKLSSAEFLQLFGCVLSGRGLITQALGQCFGSFFFLFFCYYSSAFLFLHWFFKSVCVCPVSEVWVAPSGLCI